MPVDSTHPEYDAQKCKWSRARHFLSGEDAVKKAGIEYLAKLEGQQTQEYEAYKERALFMNASDRTRRGFVGMVFRKDPVTHLGPDTQGQNAATAFSKFLGDADLKSNTLYAYSKTLCEEILGMGRMGTLIDYSTEENRPYFCQYAAEDILNWRQARIGGKMVTSMVVLSEMVEGIPAEEGNKAGEEDPFVPTLIPQIRVLLLDLSSKKPVYQVQIWQKDQTKKKKWILIETITPVRNGIPLNAIPFVFHGPRNSLPAVDKLPLEDVITVNLHHYRLSADYNHGLHFTALPTAWVSGFPDETVLKIGSTTAWVTETIGASAGFLEFKGQGLNGLKDALDKDEAYMSVLGARLLEPQKKEAETTETLKTRQSGEVATLTEIAASLSVSISQALKWAYWWITTEKTVEDIQDELASCELNSEFLTEKLDPTQLTALVGAWIQRGISHNTLLHNLRQGEMLPPGITDEDEQALIESQPPPTMVDLSGADPNKDPKTGKPKPKAKAKKK
jgi:hypothetical protein